eukprot:5846470-Pyramimonas_sp.AAC.3
MARSPRFPVVRVSGRRASALWPTPTTRLTLPTTARSPRLPLVRRGRILDRPSWSRVAKRERNESKDESDAR